MGHEKFWMGRYERLNGLLIIRRARKISFFWFSAGVSWAAQTCDGNSNIDLDVVVKTCGKLKLCSTCSADSVLNWIVDMQKPADSLSDKKWKPWREKHLAPFLFNSRSNKLYRIRIYESRVAWERTGGKKASMIACVFAPSSRAYSTAEYFWLACFFPKKQINCLFHPRQTCRPRHWTSERTNAECMIFFPMNRWRYMF